MLRMAWLANARQVNPPHGDKAGPVSSNAVGKGLASRMMWKGARLLFPGFAHDVVWNHALCTIKDEVELKHDHAPRG